METFSALIDAFGITATAEILGIRRSHVWTMRTRNSIPPLHWGALIEAAPDYGICNLDFEKCRALYAARRSPSEDTSSTLAEAS